MTTVNRFKFMSCLVELESETDSWCFPRVVSVGMMLLALCVILQRPGMAQGPAINGPQPSAQPSSFVIIPAPQAADAHKFWDTKNKSLFAATVAINIADFSVTRSNLQSGGKEFNPLARVLGTSTPALAANFAGETAAIIGISYFFHRTGHHKLERISSLVNIGASVGAVAYGLKHR